MKKEKGFTLVELLVVIAIIAILSVIGLTLFNGAQQNARDARRKSDIDAIAAALEAKKVPSKIYYSAITGSDFSSGIIPNDTTTEKYCIKTYTTEEGARGEDNPVNDDWEENSTALSCPTGFNETTIDNGFKPETGYFPADTNKSWKICARLETSSTPNVYCKNSSQ